MGVTGYVYDEGMLAHHDPNCSDHPENSSRLVSIMETFRSGGLLEWAQHIKMDVDDIDGITRVHTIQHHDLMLQTSGMADEELCSLAQQFDSIYFCRETGRSALLAAGSTVTLASAIASGKVDNGFAIVRPPGHHAEYDRPMGFCIYNNVAIAAKALLDRPATPDQPAIRRILILDWDVHHGNGTQNIFYDDPRVLFISLHRFDGGKFYPHNASADMTAVGNGPGKGKNVNIPWSGGGYGDAEYLHAFHRVVMPIAHEFDPDFVFVSAGFDAAVGDPIGGCLVTPQGFAMMTYLLKSLANGKLMLALEGGYNVEAVARSSEACMKVLLGEAVPRLPQPMPPSHTCLSIVERVIQVQSEFWSSIVPKSPSIPENPSAKSLTSVVDAYWKAVCRDQFDLLSFPILPEQFRGYFDGRVHVSPNVLDASDALVIFAHEQDMVVQTSPIDSNIVHQDTAFIQPALSSFIELSLAKDLKVIDICVPRKTWKLRQTSTGSPEDLQLYNQFFLYLWNTIISKCSTRNIVFVSSGLCNYSITKLTEIPEFRERVKAMVMFSSTLFVPIVASETGPWYQSVSRVYVPCTPKPFDSIIATASSYGSCYSGGPEGPLYSLRTPLTAFNSVREFIFKQCTLE